MRHAPRLGGITSMAVTALLLLQPAAADPAGPASFRDRFEIRGGAFVHGYDSFEGRTTDLNAELVFPEPRLSEWPADPRWRFIVPRFHVGGMVNLNGKTSYAYAGVLWTLDLPFNFLVEGFVGGSVHNGALDNAIVNGMPTRAALGCRVLFHTGGSVGYRFNRQWTVMFTYDHLSNGNAVFGACSRNQGLTQLGGRIGYTF